MIKSDRPESPFSEVMFKTVDLERLEVAAALRIDPAIIHDLRFTEYQEVCFDQLTLTLRGYVWGESHKGISKENRSNLPQTGFNKMEPQRDQDLPAACQRRIFHRHERAFTDRTMLPYAMASSPREEHSAPRSSDFLEQFPNRTRPGNS